MRDQVERVRRLLERTGVDPSLPAGSAAREALNESLRALPATLLASVAAELAESSRVTLVPDGALHLLPFAALLDPTTGYERYLVEARPLSVVASATVFAQLKAQRRPPREMRLTAFGDPSSPAAVASGERRAASGLSLEPLPATRAEVEEFGNLLGERATVWLGPDATEERAKAVGTDVTVVHFAVHGLVDEGQPLSSALALSIPERAVEGQENGLL